VRCQYSHDEQWNNENEQADVRRSQQKYEQGAHRGAHRPRRKGEISGKADRRDYVKNAVKQNIPYPIFIIKSPLTPLYLKRGILSPFEKRG
jgi:hypothetical protein